MLTDFEIEASEGRERGAVEVWVRCLRRHPATNSGLMCNWSKEVPVTRNAAEFVEWVTSATAEHDVAHLQVASR